MSISNIKNQKLTVWLILTIDIFLIVVHTHVVDVYVVAVFHKLIASLS